MTTHQATRTATSARVKTYPAPKQLATKTDLTQDEVKAITEALNPLVADAFALYVKTKNFHWHLSGSHFREYHLLFDEHADAIFRVHRHPGGARAPRWWHDDPQYQPHQ